MQTAEIRRRFLRHFERHGHTVVPSAPLLLDDPNLLFVNAGMVPFKPFFLGQQTPPYRRATSVQKCVRTLDIDEVGKTSRHGSFFQMNGNFSFGDYFKRGAIELAWSLSTGSVAEGGFGLDPDRLWATVYHDDDEAAALWKEVTGLPDERIVRRGLADNYWHMGVVGPGGPCSEIYYDRGPQYGPEGGPEVDEDRYMEFWNLVFMQYELSAVRSKVDFDVRGPLPQPNIDTGMGLERIASILQGVDNLYEIDEVAPVLRRAAELAGKRYGREHADDVRLRVVADHVRTGLMLIGDGVVPGNEGRGYVLRRILRRAVRAMRLLGVDAATLPELLPVSKDAMRASYPELERDFARISSLAYAEEESFRSTLRAGTTILDTAVREAKSAGAPQLSGQRAFQLHDTYGFPIDLTLEMAAEQGLRVDEAGFRRLMQEQRERAKADAKAKRTGHADVSAYREVQDALGRPVEFTGYDEVSGEGRVAGLLVGGAAAPAAGAGQEVELVLDRTPFYAEGGGQLADQGRITLGGGAVVEVLDVQQPVQGLLVHRARVVSGEVTAGEAVLSEVDLARRRAISRAHTATHMVHKAFREALGETATQAGSENRPGSFRFDFSAAGAVPASVLGDVEARVNALLADDLPVHAEVMTQEEAVRSGAMALFGEKYGDEVRVVSVGDWARELCGGTHAQRSGQLGLVKLLGEASIGAGVRRVEALVGTDAYSYLAREHVLVQQLTGALKVRPEELPERVSALVAQLRDAEKEIAQMRAGALLQAAPGLVEAAKDVFGVSVVTHRAPDGTSADDVRRLVLDVRGRFAADRPVAVAVAAKAGERPVVVVAVNETGRSWGVKAGLLVREAAKVLGGGGGGKDDVAQGGGQDATRIGDALAAVEHAVGRQVTGG
ncbi:alanine--tRNA ligase [Vallicoccus soli]|uniref:Alanine--tRNA ligase n=1 Tax=Vallicoccus soli TaxID=2339232 RepID=A0A3A3YYB4_9ACTN|nr:alanine--tRNA ligase [Vallicoccus soli]RJK96781.1 alanine--tRNA ligase [Vallicoccus soli]